ncbi:MAG: ABC transporter permease [Acidimicrobiales bacterium]
MTATTTTLAPSRGSTPGRLSRAVADGSAICARNLRVLVRLPQAVVFATIQPVIFVLMFRYVFGGAIRVTDGPYVDFLIPGIFVTTVVFGAMGTAVGLADDLGKGLIERLRSLPMAPSAVLTGRTAADLVRNVFVVALMAVVGFLVGFRVHTGVVAFLAALLLVLLFSYSLLWLFALVGLATANAETAQAASFPIMAPLTFASSAFVPVASMPGWLQPYADNQPVSATVDAARALVLGGPTTGVVLQALAWSVGILVVAATLAVRRYRRVV